MNVDVQICGPKPKRTLAGFVKRYRTLTCAIICAAVTGITLPWRTTGYVICAVHELAFIGYTTSAFLGWRLSCARRKRFKEEREVIEFWMQNTAKAFAAQVAADKEGTWAEKQEAYVTFQQAQARFAKEATPILVRWHEEEGI